MTPLLLVAPRRGSPGPGRLPGERPGAGSDGREGSLEVRSGPARDGDAEGGDVGLVRRKSAPGETRTPFSRAAAAGPARDAVGQLDPEDPAAERPLAARPDWEPLADDAVGEREPRLQPQAGPPEVAVELPARDKEVQRRLQDRRRGQLANALQRREAVDEFSRPRDPADADTGEERLTESSEVDDVGRRERREGRRQLSLDEEVGVEGVLDEEDAGRDGPFRELRPARGGREEPRRVLEVGDRVEELRAAPRAPAPSDASAGPSASSGIPSRRARWARKSERAPGVARALDRDGVPGVDERARDEVEPLLRAVHDQDAVRVRRDAAPRQAPGERLAERPVSERRAVREERAVLCHLGEGGGEGVRRELPLVGGERGTDRTLRAAPSRTAAARP